MNRIKLIITIATVSVGALALTGAKSNTNYASDIAVATEKITESETAETAVEGTAPYTEAPTETTTPATASTVQTTIATTTTTTTIQKVDVKNLKAETVSVSCIKVFWDEADADREYELYVETAAPYIDNLQFLFDGNNTCYLTGLRENSEYNIRVTPVLKESENAVAVSDNIVCKTEQVEILQEFELEEGWTNCFTGEKASGLTRMPSSGAIADSFCDTITGTGIRRKENGDYCCAMGLHYGVVGDRFLIELENGTQFTVQICDSKGMADDADGDGVADGRFHWYGGEGNGKSVVEFIYDDSNLPSNVSFTGSWGYENWNGLDLRANIISVKKIAFAE